MTTQKKILRALGRIEGRLTAFEDISARLARLEAGQFRMKGMWAALAAAYAYLFKTTH